MDREATSVGAFLQEAIDVQQFSLVSEYSACSCQHGSKSLRMKYPCIYSMIANGGMVAQWAYLPFVLIVRARNREVP